MIHVMVGIGAVLANEGSVILTVGRISKSQARKRLVNPIQPKGDLVNPLKASKKAS